MLQLLNWPKYFVGMALKKKKVILNMGCSPLASECLSYLDVRVLQLGEDLYECGSTTCNVVFIFHTRVNWSES